MGITNGENETFATPKVDPEDTTDIGEKDDTQDPMNDEPTEEGGSGELFSDGNTTTLDVNINNVSVVITTLPRRDSMTNVLINTRGSAPNVDQETTTYYIEGKDDTQEPMNEEATEVLSNDVITIENLDSGELFSDGNNTTVDVNINNISVAITTTARRNSTTNVLVNTRGSALKFVQENTTYLGGKYDTPEAKNDDATEEIVSNDVITIETLGSELPFSDGNNNSVDVNINNISIVIPLSTRRNSTTNILLNTRSTTDFPKVDSNTAEVKQLRNPRSLKDEKGPSNFDLLSKNDLDILSDGNKLISINDSNPEVNNDIENLRAIRSAPNLVETPRVLIEEPSDIDHYSQNTGEPVSQSNVRNSHNAILEDKTYNEEILLDTIKERSNPPTLRKVPKDYDLYFGVEINNKMLLRDEKNLTQGLRKARSVEEYNIKGQGYTTGGQYQFRPPKPYLPNEPPYFLVDGEQKESNMDFMTYDTVLPFVCVQHLGALALAFQLDNDKYYLLLLLPLRNDGLDDLIYDIQMHNTFKYIVKNLKLTHVRAVIPSFNLKGRIVLTNTVQKLGINKIFQPGQADFTPMTNDENIYVTNIEQAVSVTIKNNIKLSEAERYETYQQYPEPIRFDVNHPFLYFVIDSGLELILMTGKVVNPLNIQIK